MWKFLLRRRKYLRITLRTYHKSQKDLGNKEMNTDRKSLALLHVRRQTPKTAIKLSLWSRTSYNSIPTHNTIIPYSTTENKTPTNIPPRKINQLSPTNSRRNYLGPCWKKRITPEVRQRNLQNSTELNNTGTCTSATHLQITNKTQSSYVKPKHHRNPISTNCKNIPIYIFQENKKKHILPAQYQPFEKIYQYPH